jgi:S1/P1 Nuclease
MMYNFNIILDALDSPPSGCNVDYQRDCFNSEHEGGCVISAIVNQTQLFLDPNSDSTTRREAIMFIMHFIGDLHQPLHVEDVYTGGNDIPTCFRKACAHNELHAVWDTDIIHKLVGIPNSAKHDEEKAAASEWAEKLYEANKGLIDQQCADVTDSQKCTMQWAEEANGFVCSYVLNVGGLGDMDSVKNWFQDRDLSTDYYDGAVPVVEQMVGLAGIRLGAYLTSLVNAAQQLEVPSSQKVLGDVEL